MGEKLVNEGYQGCPFCGDKNHFRDAHRINLLIPDIPVGYILEGRCMDLVYSEMVKSSWYDKITHCKIIELVHPKFEVVPAYAPPWTHTAENFLEKFSKFKTGEL